VCTPRNYSDIFWYKGPTGLIVSDIVARIKARMDEHPELAESERFTGLFAIMAVLSAWLNNTVAGSSSTLA
jgi:hypothetical protein